MNIDESMLAQIQAEVTERMKQAIIDELIGSITWEAKRVIKEKVTADVCAFYDEHIKKDLVDALETDKEIIIGTARAAQREISNAVTEAIIKRAVNNLTGYKGKDIIKMLMSD